MESKSTKKLLRKRPVTEKPILRKTITPPTNWDLYGLSDRDGLSYSLISKFIVCRERFRLRTVEGLVESGSSREAMEFGTIFHKALEFSAQGKSRSQIFSYLRRKSREGHYDPLLCQIASLMVPMYQDFWKAEIGNIHYVETESVFDFPYKCSYGRVVRLRGRRDEGFIKDGKLWLQENKTKGQIQEHQIVQTLSSMLQPMLYLLSFKVDHPKEQLGGILYNVIRKPQLKQGKKESDSEYLQRIATNIEKRPEHYFKMFEVEIDDAHLEHWRQRYLDPLISQICIWWESIRNHPFDPWVLDTGEPNPHHFLRPFGVYDPMSQGTGDYFGRIVQGHDAGLERSETCFPELVDD